MKYRSELFIGGQWVGGTSTVPVRDPALDETIAEVAVAGEDECAQAVDAASSALGPWAARAPRERAEILRRAFELMTAEAGQIAELIVRENGKVLADARAEVTYAAEFFRWFAEEAVRVQGDYRLAPGGDKRIIVTHQPVGVSLLITPWNFPAAMATRKIGPALAAGCSVVLKPATETPLTALAIADVLWRAGVPDGVVNVVVAAPTAQRVREMLHDPRVTNLSFTGSTEVGRVLLHEAADQVVRTSMELGGNAPFLVLAGADVTAAVQGAMVAKLRNGGAACTAANRFYVHRSVAKEFTSALANAMAGLKVGPGLDPSSEIGSLVSTAERGKVAELVERATGAGARPVSGGSVPAGAGAFYPPTVLADVAPDADILDVEIFGPVAPIVTFDDEEEAVARANGTPFGLISYVYSGDLRRGLQVADRLESGMVAVNRGVLSDPAAPFGGYKQSGLGREGGFDGIHEFLETKYIAADV
ncbi:NAD-dependent succinate-semialdehyde dehydrogenase [Sphaerisporangium sp. NPDC049002]|uniref:NAD-dependent succinate-semialdehyde dehydrogenase n=1 Tax=Sphaerisporangium sp. NPDC049002 TaxID=3155392 RepID=UPI0033E9C844